ncbi:MAG: hypothetical protein MJZ37_06425 [Bacilli bacterium]|nr:hypothetical protein [Bacilli bacterium]
MRGKKRTPEDIYAIMVSYATTHSYMETSKQLDIPVATVKKIVDENIEKEEFKKLCNEKKEEFVTRADRIIEKAMKRLENEIEAADSIPVNNLSTVIGTLYDKRALAKGDPTSNEAVTIRVELTDE